MYNIAILGAGRIGTFHLQAMARLEGTAKIQLVDPSEESLRNSREQFSQVYKRDSEDIELLCHRFIDDMTEPVDLAIVATCSNIRSEVIKELTSRKEVKNLILEKVLFQTVDEYYEIDELLRKKNISAWVNCYMRSRDFFKELRNQINLGEKVEMRVDGSLWGMGCNSIHFIDYFAYVTGCNDINFIDYRLSSSIFNSKRPGYKEFSGELVVENSQGHSLVLNCRDKGNDPLVITIKNGSNEHEIIDCNDHTIHNVFDGTKKAENIVVIPFQSQASHELVHQVRDSGSCDLTTYKDSMNLHIPLINIFIEHMQTLSGEIMEICPIT